MTEDFDPLDFDGLDFVAGDVTVSVSSETGGVWWYARARRAREDEEEYLVL